MKESITTTTNHFTGCATLAAIGAKLQQLDFFSPIRKRVQIRQKTIKHTPLDKLMDAFISLLAGAHGLVEINSRLRADPGLQRAFGRTSCAEQSVVQETLSAWTEENVLQLHQALDEIYHAESQGVQTSIKRSIPTTNISELMCYIRGLISNSDGSFLKTFSLCD